MSDIRNFEEYRRQVLDSLGEDYTVEDLRNFERWRLKVLHGLGGSGKIYSTLAVTDSASGSIASITDGGDGLPVKTLNVSIVPKQSGSGDPSPSNVRPISGTDTVDVTRCGLNILPKMVAGTYSANGGTIVVDNDGVAHLSGTTTASGNVATIPLETPITITQDMVDKGLYYHLRNSEINANISPSLENNSAVLFWSIAFSPLNRISGPAGSVGVGKTVTRIRFYVSSGVTLSGIYAPSLEFTNEATAYEPYEGESKSIPLGQTVYGGTLDVVSGEGKKTMGYVDLGTLNWGKNGNIFYARIDDLKWVEANTTPNAFCSVFKIMSKNDWSVAPTENSLRYDNTDPNIYVRNSTYTDAESFKASVVGQTLAYEIQTPTDFNTTPTPINTLLGSNNIYSDSGSVEVEYRADTKKYVDKKIAETQAMILENIGG